MTMTRLLLLFLVMGLLACSGTNFVDVDSGAPSSSGICADLGKIGEVPLKTDWPIEDKYYISLRAQSTNAKHCLIEQITNETPMKDPRSEPTKVEGFVVGDLAFFLLADFGFVDFNEVLPDDVQAKLPDRGVLAYFNWVKASGNRQALQDRCRQWVAEH